jgi:hypothetical protein
MTKDKVAVALQGLFLVPEGKEEMLREWEERVAVNAASRGGFGETRGAAGTESTEAAATGGGGGGGGAKGDGVSASTATGNAERHRGGGGGGGTGGSGGGGGENTDAADERVKQQDAMVGRKKVRACCGGGGARSRSVGRSVAVRVRMRVCARLYPTYTTGCEPSPLFPRIDARCGILFAFPWCCSYARGWTAGAQLPAQP